MTLFILLLIITLVLFALFLGGGLVAQGYLYQEPAAQMPVRALAAAVLVGSFVTMWVWVDKLYPRRYDTFFEFAPYERKEFSEFDAVRWTASGDGKLKTDESGKLAETELKFVKGTGSKSEKFVEEGTDSPFQLNGGTRTGDQFMTGAILVKPDPESEKIRLDAVLNTDKRTGAKSYPDQRRFVEVNGSRYVEADQLGMLYVPSTSTIVLALLINFGLYLVWFIAFWPILQFTRGHAFGMTVLFGLVTMLMLMPLLFRPNRAKAPAAEPVRVGWVERGAMVAGG